MYQNLIQSLSGNPVISMEQIIIGDIMQGISVLDVKEINSGNQMKVSLLEGPSSPYCTLWVTDLIILTPTRYLVTD